MRFEFATASRILFGPGIVQQLPQIAAEFGRRALVVTGRNRDRAMPVIAALKRSGVDVSIYPVEGEPTLESVRAGARIAKQGCEFVIAFGGGSALDAGKAIGALATTSGEPLDYVEVIGKGKPLEHPPLPVLAVPTTAGTGAEVTRNAVLGSPEHGVKASLRSPMMLPKVALVDPDLTLFLPPGITAITGMDTLTQLMEAYLSSRANALADLFCKEGLQRVARSLRPAVANGQDREARESMSFASLLSGLALANAGLGVVHGFAAPLGGMLDAAHGALCAAVLPLGMEINIRALRQRAPQHTALARYAGIAQILTGRSNASAEEGAAWVAGLCKEFSISPLGSFGLQASQIPVLVEKAAKANSMKANPIPLTSEELTEIALRALG